MDTSLSSMPPMIRKPRPRTDANISPIITPRNVIEKLRRSAVTSSGMVLGMKMKANVCGRFRRSTLAVRTSAGLIERVAL